MLPCITKIVQYSQINKDVRYLLFTTSLMPAVDNDTSEKKSRGCKTASVMLNIANIIFCKTSFLSYSRVCLLYTHFTLDDLTPLLYTLISYNLISSFTFIPHLLHFLLLLCLILLWSTNTQHTHNVLPSISLFTQYTMWYLFPWILIRYVHVFVLVSSQDLHKPI